MMTIQTVLALVAEMEEEKKKDVRVPHYYKYRGEMKRRSYDDVIHTDRYNELFDLLASDEAKVFKCEECGEMCDWFDLESWCCDFEAGYYICGCCYEDAMGEDL
jgi:hypothetical protein